MGRRILARHGFLSAICSCWLPRVHDYNKSDHAFTLYATVYRCTPRLLFILLSVNVGPGGTATGPSCGANCGRFVLSYVFVCDALMPCFIVSNGILYMNDERRVGEVVGAVAVNTPIL